MSEFAVSILRSPKALAKSPKKLRMKPLLKQQLTRTVLNPRSPEVWRETGQEREFGMSAGRVEVRRLGRGARGYWGFCARS